MKLRCSAILLGACLCASAQDAAGIEVHAMVEAMTTALSGAKPAALRAVFDPKMPGFKRLSEDIGSLLRSSEAPSSVDFLSNTGDDHTRDLELDWRMQIRSDNGESTVERRARVKLHAVKQGNDWRIESFAPLDFFAPAQSGDIWDMLSEALGSLTEGSGGRGHDVDTRAPSNFLAAFDSKMPGYDTLVSNILALAHEGNIESYVELVTSQGDDRRRMLELDWTLSVVRPETGVAILRRHERVKCEVERQGKSWKIVSLDPMDFLAPEKPK